MYTVKISTREGEDAKFMLRQTVGGRGISKCGKYRFFLNEEIEDPDFWVVRGKGITHTETCRVAPENTILMLSEPRTIVNYPKKYRDQFATLYTCQPEIRHKNKIHSHAILPWFVGMKKENGRTVYSLDYDTLKAMERPEKTKLISVITSNKAFTRGHQQRIAFVEKLKKHYGDTLDVYGRGYNGFEDKWDVLAPYKYHIAVENVSGECYWTEKIADCFLAGTYPIYSGCKNLGDSFPQGAYTQIDIGNFEAAVAAIDRVIADQEYEKSRDLLDLCREMILERYNMFDFIAACCDKLDPLRPKSEVTLKPAVTLLDWHNIYLYTVYHNFYKWKHALRKRFRGKSVLQSPQTK